MYLSGRDQFQRARLRKGQETWGRDGSQMSCCLACHNPHNPLVEEAGFYRFQMPRMPFGKGNGKEG